MRPAVSSAARSLRPGSDLAVRLIALSVGVLGVLNLWSSLLARGPGRDPFLKHTVHMPLLVEHNSRTIIALFGVALLMLARSLGRRKRQAWRIALFLSVLAPLPHLAKGLDYEEAVICVVMAGVLMIWRNAFYAENDAPSARQGLIAALTFVGFAAVYGPVGYYLLRDKFSPAFTWDRAVNQTTHQLFFHPRTRSLAWLTPRAHWFDQSLVVVSIFSMGLAMIMLLRPVLPRDRHGMEERDRARRLLETWGGDPIGWFSLLHDKRYLFDHSDAEPSWGMAYVVVGRDAVVLGDPLGDPTRAADAVRAFLDHCRQHDWSPALYQVTPRNLNTYRSARLRSLKVGEDALLDLPGWSMKGKAFQDLRTAINKMGKIGIAFEEFDPLCASAADTLTQMAAISESWLRAQHGEEKTFGMGRFDPDGDGFRDGRIFLARADELGRVLGFVSFVPIFGKGWGLDLMRRTGDAPNGLMEFLIASSALCFQAEGALIMSLGLSPLSGGGFPDPAEVRLIGRGRQIVYNRFNYFYAFKGLHAFKEKFGPRWEPRYLVYAGESALGRTVYAVIRAHSPRGLWTFLAR